MDEENKKDELENVTDDNEEITYKYMSMGTYSYDDDNNSSSNNMFSVQKDDGMVFKSGKKSKFSLFLIILILLLSFGYGIYYFSSKASNNDEDTTVTENKEEEKKETDKDEEEEKKQPNPETELTDQKVKDILKKKVETLDVYAGDRRTVLFDKSRKIDEFSDLDLMLVALYNVKSQKVDNGQNYCYDLKTQKLEYKPQNCGYDMIVSYVVAKDLEMFYRSMFGIPLKKEEMYSTCPMMLYNKEKDIYYLSNACGGAGVPTNLKYIYKYTETVEATYVYVAYGVMGANGDVFTDYDMKKQYKKEDYNFEITADNYQDFSKYKLVFEKKDNDLHFVYIEKLEQ